MPKEKSIHEIKQTKCLVVDPVNFLLLNQVHIRKLYNTTTMFKYFKFISGKYVLATKKLSTSEKYNILKYPRYAIELVRSECFSKLRGSQTNALIHDLKPFFKENVDLNHIMLDKSKLDRAKTKVCVVSEKCRKQR